MEKGIVFDRQESITIDCENNRTQTIVRERFSKKKHKPKRGKGNENKQKLICYLHNEIEKLKRKRDQLKQQKQVAMKKNVAIQNDMTWGQHFNQNSTHIEFTIEKYSRQHKCVCTSPIYARDEQTSCRPRMRTISVQESGRRNTHSRKDNERKSGVKVKSNFNKDTLLAKCSQNSKYSQPYNMDENYTGIICNQNNCKESGLPCSEYNYCCDEYNYETSPHSNRCRQPCTCNSYCQGDCAGKLLVKSHRDSKYTSTAEIHEKLHKENTAKKAKLPKIEKYRNEFLGSDDFDSSSHEVKRKEKLIKTTLRKQHTKALYSDEDQVGWDNSVAGYSKEILRILRNMEITAYKPSMPHKYAEVDAEMLQESHIEAYKKDPRTGGKERRKYGEYIDKYKQAQDPTVKFKRDSNQNSHEKYRPGLTDDVRIKSTALKHELYEAQNMTVLKGRNNRQLLLGCTDENKDLLNPIDDVHIRKTHSNGIIRGPTVGATAENVNDNANFLEWRKDLVETIFRNPQKCVNADAEIRTDGKVYIDKNQQDPAPAVKSKRHSSQNSHETCGNSLTDDVGIEKNALKHVQYEADLPYEAESIIAWKGSNNNQVLLKLEAKDEGQLNQMDDVHMSKAYSHGVATVRNINEKKNSSESCKDLLDTSLRNPPPTEERFGQTGVATASVIDGNTYRLGSHKDPVTLVSIYNMSPIPSAVNDCIPYSTKETINTPIDQQNYVISDLEVREGDQSASSSELGSIEVRSSTRELSFGQPFLGNHKYMPLLKRAGNPTYPQTPVEHDSSFRRYGCVSKSENLVPKIHLNARESDGTSRHNQLFAISSQNRTNGSDSFQVRAEFKNRLESKQPGQKTLVDSDTMLLYDIQDNPIQRSYQAEPLLNHIKEMKHQGAVYYDGKNLCYHTRRRRANSHSAYDDTIYTTESDPLLGSTYATPRSFRSIHNLTSTNDAISCGCNRRANSEVAQIPEFTACPCMLETYLNLIALYKKTRIC